MDGPSHKARKTIEADQRKEAFLRARGWKVLRFENKIVERNLSGVVKAILAECSILPLAPATSLLEGS